MSGTTKKIIAEQVLKRLDGGYSDTADPIDERDVYKATEQKINALFKLRHLDTTLPSGETLPENAMIATYENIAVTSLDNGKSYATLPVTPISMTKNMGIFMIYDPTTPDNFFIPLQRSQLALLKADELLSDLMGSIGYEPKNQTVTFTKDLTFFGINNVTMELCVFDMSKYSLTDRLPIPADMEDQIIQELVKDFSPVQPEDGTVNNFTSAGQSQTK